MSQSRYMALKEFFSPKRDKIDDFDDPNTFEKEDCVACRVLGLDHFLQGALPVRNITLIPLSRLNRPGVSRWLHLLLGHAAA